MKKTIWIMGMLLTGACLLSAAPAQETSVASPTGAVVVAPAQPKPPSAMAGTTGTVHAATPPKGGNTSFFGAAGGSSTNQGGMTITSDRIEFDYKEMVIAFDENVHVVDPQYTMTSQRMLVFLEGTNQIKRIIAIGNVDVAQPDRHATCEKAIYEHATGEIAMTGNPVLIHGADRVVGTKIIVYLNDSRIVVEGGGRVNLSPETMKNREIKP